MFLTEKYLHVYGFGFLHKQKMPSWCSECSLSYSPVSVCKQAVVSLITGFSSLKFEAKVPSQYDLSC